ncbi:MAG TPA: homocysteine S-methyltransferase family protein, partial [Thermoanaerobaculales bacterium]|nr:homocysteine S-methyltransferase family protein [Thermoanaerobaculales bacterium]
MEPLLPRVASGRTIVGDGALGTSLMARGLRVQDCLESAVLSRPDLIEEIAAAYLSAGSEVLTTDSFGASPLKLSSYGLDSRTEEINRRAVELLR